MEKHQPKSSILYIILSIIAVIAVVVLLMLSQAQMIAGFLLGILVTAGVISTVIATIKQLYGADGERNALVRFLAGPLPKALLMLLGLILCKKFPNIFNMFGYVLGLASYAFVFITVAVMEYFRTRKYPKK